MRFPRMFFALGGLGLCGGYSVIAGKGNIAAGILLLIAGLGLIGLSIAQMRPRRPGR